MTEQELMDVIARAQATLDHARVMARQARRNIETAYEAIERLRHPEPFNPAEQTEAEFP